MPGNNLSGEIPRTWQSLWIRRLYLSGNGLSYEIPSELASLTNPESVYIAGNRLACCCLAVLSRAAMNDLAASGLQSCE